MQKNDVGICVCPTKHAGYEGVSGQGKTDWGDARLIARR
ncbi:MAG: hypothetical protein JWL63_1493 [Rhodocyclales bacterium]|nr:hypothetical protein [Rhodocyclales bacterium]